MYLHIHIPAEEGEDDVEELLVVTLVLGIVTVGDGEEVGLEKAEHLVEIFMVQGRVHTRHGGQTLLPAHIDIVGQKALHQSYTYLPVGNVEGVKVGCPVIVLDGDIAALIEQGSDGFHALRGGIEGRGHDLNTGEVGGGSVELPHHLYKEGRRAALEPVTPEGSVLKGIEEAEGVEDVGRGPCEVIAVILTPEGGECLLTCRALLCSHSVEVAGHLREDLVHRDAAHPCKLLVHADVLQVVQFAEDAELGKLRDAREEDELSPVTSPAPSKLGSALASSVSSR